MIIWNLQSLGIVEGDALMVHASLRSVGNFENRAAILISALLDALGPSGTLLMPALSYENVTAEQPVFDVRQTPSCVGALTEYFRTLPFVERSLHPTHSVCATGSDTAFFLGSHHRDDTPCGPLSPFHKLMERKGRILFLGCGLRPNTSMHGIEELSPPSYLFGKKMLFNIIMRDGTEYHKAYITHDFTGAEQRYERVTEVLDNDDFTTGKVLEADAWLLNSEALWEKTHRKLLQDPWYFVDRILG